MDRHQHLQWCKERALEYVRGGDLLSAYSSFVSDMKKHPETADHIAVGLGMILMLGGHLSTPDDMAQFINDFN